MQPLRILHVIPSLALEDGGPTRAMLQMEDGLVKAGMAVTTLTTTSKKNGPLADTPTGAHRIYFRRLATSYKVAPELATALPGLLRRHDVLHVHALFSFAPNLAAIFAQAFGVPYVMRPLGTLAPYGLASRRPALKRLSLACMEAPLLRKAAAVHFTSQAELGEARQLGLKMRGVVIPLGVAPPEGPCESFEHPAIKGRTTLLFMSRLDPKKNLESLIDAAAASTIFASSGVLLVAGEGSPGYTADLKTRAARAGLNDRILWLGHVDGALKSAILAAADIFVLPSFSENFGIAAAEALGAGLPCILGKGVAIAEEVVAADAGLSVRPEASAIGTAIDSLLSSPSTRTRMGHNARRLASDRYSTAAMTQRLVKLYQDVCAKRRMAEP